ncbi:MAG: hypothetical protein KJ706_06625 [Candidatus Omnitrophica bacterium]|nr:hypothetical protein [Candidatus Omnitrophota bacterium]MBU4457246.1 hypothetical protein [Candidatus Omnitrophota bacterium]
MDKNIMNNITPLIASPALKLGAKNDAKVSATRDRLAKSRNFSAYNLRWKLFISILRDIIAYEEACVKQAAQVEGSKSNENNEINELNG